MQNALAGITRIKGVRGFGVFDARGACVAHQMPAPYESILLKCAIDELRGAFDAVKCLEESGMDSFIGRFTLGNVVLKPIANHTVLILTDPDLNMAALNVGLKVASLKLEPGESGQISTRIEAGATSAIHFSPNASVSSSLSLGSPLNESRIPANAISIAVMSELTQLLAVRIGPMAKLALKGALTSMGLHPRAVSPSQFDDLVALVARKIPDAGARQGFTIAAQALLRSP
jgi:hypothetical protein